MRRAAAMGIGGFVSALAIGVGAFVVTSSTAVDVVEAAGRWHTTYPVELRATRIVPQGHGGMLSVAPSVSVIPVNEQALQASRAASLEAELEPDNPPELAVMAFIDTALPVLLPGDRVLAPITFYYCERGEIHPGDGGGFCGFMRDGSVVYEGAAACDYAYLGQRFRILGDPLERTYYCADTGSSVHGYHRDIWFHDSDQGWGWQRSVGQHAIIEILP